MKRGWNAHRAGHDMTSFHGSCLCGSITFELSAEPTGLTYCHCVSCRKARGTAFAVNAAIDRADVSLEDSAATLREFESSPGKMRAFCSRCGSPVFAYSTARPDVLRMRMGLIDTPFAGRPEQHIWVSQMPEWDTICDDVPRFERFAER